MPDLEQSKTIFKIFDYNTKELVYEHEETDFSTLNLHKVSEEGILIVGNKYRIEVVQVLSDGTESPPGIIPLYIPARLDVIPEVLIKPVILIPQENDTIDKGTRLVASTFRSEPANSLVHQSSEWKFSYSATMSPLIQMTGTTINSGNKTEFTIPIDLAKGSNIYATVSYTAVGGILKETSDVCTFLTPIAEVPETITKPSILMPNHPINVGMPIYGSPFVSYPRNNLTPSKGIFRFSLTSDMSSLIANTASESVGSTYEQYGKYIVSATLFNYLSSNNIEKVYGQIKYQASNGTSSEWSDPIQMSVAALGIQNRPEIKTVTVDKINKTIKLIPDTYTHPDNVAIKAVSYRLVPQSGGTAKASGWLTVNSSSFAAGYTFNTVSIGTYAASVMVRDNNNRDSEWSVSKTVSLEDTVAPNKPTVTGTVNNVLKTITVKGNAYTHPENIAYKDLRYRINGNETAWFTKVPTTEHVFNGLNLGSYSIELKYRDTSLKESLWSDSITFEITSTTLPNAPVLDISNTLTTIDIDIVQYSHPDDIEHESSVFKIEKIGELPVGGIPKVKNIEVTDNQQNSISITLKQTNVKNIALTDAGTITQYSIEKL